MKQLLNVDGESGSFKLAFDELMDTVNTYAEVQSLLIPLLLAPVLDQATYLLRVIKLMDMRHRLVCMQRELYSIMMENSRCEENAPVIVEALTIVDETIDKYLEGARQCPEFLN